MHELDENWYKINIYYVINEMKITKIVLKCDAIANGFYPIKLEIVFYYKYTYFIKEKNIKYNNMIFDKN